MIRALTRCALVAMLISVITASPGHSQNLPQSAPAAPNPNISAPAAPPPMPLLDAVDIITIELNALEKFRRAQSAASDGNKDVALRLADEAWREAITNALKSRVEDWRTRYRGFHAGYLKAGTDFLDQGEALYRAGNYAAAGEHFNSAWAEFMSARNQDLASRAEQRREDSECMAAYQSARRGSNAQETARIMNRSECARVADMLRASQQR